MRGRRQQLQATTAEFRRIGASTAAFLDRSCGKKKIYFSKRLAKRVEKQSRARGENIQAYKCEYSSHYHVGHIKGEPRKISEC